MKLLFIDGTKGFTPTRLATKPCGGILTSLTIIPRHLAAAGHDVTVLSLHETAEDVAGVHYLPIKTDITTLPAYDVVVFNRNCLDARVCAHFRSKGARLVWWLHDIVDPRYLSDDPQTFGVDRIVALSQYCVDSYADFYGLSRELFDVIGNGVDPDVFYRDLTWQRRRDLFVTASAPVKGLYSLPFMWDNLKRIVPTAELRLYSSQGLHDLENTSEHARLLTALRQSGARVMDPVPQSELASVFREATALLMPNSYPEICSNVLLQAQACGLPVIASPIGSAREYISHEINGLLTRTMPHDMHWFNKEYAQLVIDLARDHELQDSLINRASTPPTWQQIGLAWSELIESLTPAVVVA